MGDIAYRVSERVFYRASPVEEARSATVERVRDDALVVSVAGEKEKVDVPIASVSASVARRFEERQKVLLSPGGAVEIGKKDKKPKGTHASVSDVDASYWPPSYMVREEGKSGHKPAKASEMVSLELALLVAADEAAKELVAREEKEAREREAAARAKAEKAAAKKAAREKHEAEASAESAASAAAPPGFAKPPPRFRGNVCRFARRRGSREGCRGEVCRAREGACRAGGAKGGARGRGEGGQEQGEEGGAEGAPRRRGGGACGARSRGGDGARR